MEADSWMFRIVALLVIFSGCILCDADTSPNLTSAVFESSITATLENTSTSVPADLVTATGRTPSDDEEDPTIGDIAEATTIPATLPITPPTITTVTTVVPTTTVTTTITIATSRNTSDLLVQQMTERSVTSEIHSTSTDLLFSNTTETRAALVRVQTNSTETVSSVTTDEAATTVMGDTTEMAANPEDISNSSILTMEVTTSNENITQTTPTAEATTVHYSFIISTVSQTDSSRVEGINITYSAENASAVNVTIASTPLGLSSVTSVVPETTALPAETITTISTTSTSATTPRWISLEEGTARLHITGITIVKFNVRHSRAIFRILIAKYLTRYCDDQPEECLQLKEQQENCRCENVIIKQSSMEQDRKGLEVSIFIKRAFFRNTALVTKATLQRTVNKYGDDLHRDFGYKIEVVKRGASRSGDGRPETWVIIVAVAVPGLVLILLFIFVVTTYRRRSKMRYQTRTSDLPTGRAPPAKPKLERTTPKTFDNPAFDTVNEASESSAAASGVEQCARTAV